jgi:hypothetical protein
LNLKHQDTRAVYTLLRNVGSGRLQSDWPDCGASFAQAHNVVRGSDDVCTVSSLESLRILLKAYDDEKAKPTADSEPLSRRRDHPLSTIGVTARPGVFNDSEGVHGSLSLLDVSPGSPAELAGLKRGDVIFALGDPRPAIGEELLLRIAAASPGAALQIAYFDGLTHAKRQTRVTAAALD